MTLTPFEKLFLQHCRTRLANEAHPHIVVVWSRFYGCSTVNIILAKILANQKPGSKIIYVCQAGKECDQLRLHFGITVPGYTFDDEGHVRFQNGSMIKLVSVAYWLLQSTQLQFDLVILEKGVDHVDHILARLQTTPTVVNRNIDVLQATVTLAKANKLPVIEYSKRTSARARVTTILCKAFEKNKVTRDIALDVVRYFL